jgi:hypothetical protein
MGRIADMIRNKRDLKIAADEAASAAERAASEDDR